MKKVFWILIGATIIVGITLGMFFMSNAITDMSAKYTSESTAGLVQNNSPVEWEEYLFPEDEVIEVRIYMDDSQFAYMSENAIDEVFVPASVVYNGITVENIAIRPKGNSSLKYAVTEGNDQYSLHMEFDEYIDQDVYGITEINLNNCYGDETYIREKLAYEIMEEMGLPVPETVFCNVYINDEPFGVYLAVQQVDEQFLSAWFEEGTGDLYKPEGTGADLVYIDDDYDTYTGIIEKTNVDKEGEQALVNMLDVLNNGGDIEDVLDVDMILRYLAVNTSIINLDSYVGGMFHNYFLYGEDGEFTIIPWDLNETFMPFGAGGQDTTDVTGFLIDEPTSGAVANYPLVDVLLSNPAYLEKYHGYLEEIIEGPMQINTFTERVEELYSLIDEYIAADPFASYKSFLNGLYDTGIQEAITQTVMAGKMDKESPALIDFVAARIENIAAQLSGEIASTNSGQGNDAGVGARQKGNNAVGLDAADMINNEGAVPGDKPAGRPPVGDIPAGRPAGDMPAGDAPAGGMPLGNALQTGALPVDTSMGTVLADNVQYIMMTAGSLVLVALALVVKRSKRK